MELSSVEKNNNTKTDRTETALKRSNKKCPCGCKGHLTTTLICLSGLKTPGMVITKTCPCNVYPLKPTFI